MKLNLLILLKCPSFDKQTSTREHDMQYNREICKLDIMNIFLKNVIPYF